MSILRTAKALKRAQDTIAQLQDDVADLQRARRKLDLEFTELYDKVSHQMGRMAKRYAARTKVDESLEENETNSEAVIGSDYVSQSILARRTRGRHG